MGDQTITIRGLDNENGTTMINGVVMNKIYDGRPQWGNWGGLTYATRNQEFTSGTAPSYTFGGILGNTRNQYTCFYLQTRYKNFFSQEQILITAGELWQRMLQECKLTDGHLLFEVQEDGAQEGYFEGTDYSANSLFASV